MAPKRFHMNVKRSSLPVCGRLGSGTASLETEAMHRTLATVLATILLFAQFSGPGRADDMSDCENGRGKVAVRGCTKIIAAGTARGETLNAKNLAVAHLFRGVGYHAVGDSQKALADLGKALQLNPKLAIAYVSRGNVHHAAADHDAAIADYNRALEINPRNVVAYANRGVVYKDLGDVDRAMADLNHAIKLKPTFAGAYHSRGHIHLAADRLEKAVADFKKAVALNRRDGRFHHSLGEAYLYAGDEESAMSSWRSTCAVATRDMVRKWQTRLQSFKFYSGKIDGLCGDMTIEAFRDCATRKCSLWPVVKLKQAEQ